MPFGLVISLVCHAALLGWALVSMRGIPPLPMDQTPIISAELITASDFLSLKKGSEAAKALETKVTTQPTEDDSQRQEKKPDNAPPPAPSSPPQEVAEVAPVEPPKAAEPEPVKKIEPPKVEPEPVKAAEPPPQPGPTPDEQKILEQKLLDEQRAAEDAKKKADDDAKRKAAEDAKKKADDDAKKKKLAEALKKKKADEARKKADADKKKFDASKIASLLDSAAESPPKALLDKDPKAKGQQASGTSESAAATGREAGTATGTAPKLSAREQDLLKGRIAAQLAKCWRITGAGGGESVPIVTLRWRLKPDGALDGAPQVQNAPNDAAGQIAAETAVRAVKSCEPFELPPETYSTWRELTWTFNPQDML